MMSGKNITITENEAESLVCFIDSAFIPYIKDDPDIDSLLFIKNIVSIYEKCGGLNQYSDYDGPYKEIMEV